MDEMVQDQGPVAAVADAGGSRGVVTLAAPALAPAVLAPVGKVTPACSGCGGTCGGNSTATAKDFVFAIGEINFKFPNLSVEKEFLSMTSTIPQKNNDRQTTIATLRKFTYLARSVCWLLLIDGVESYVLQPRNPEDFNQLVDALADPATDPTARSVVLGLKGGIAPATMCNGSLLPILKYDVISTFNSQDFVKSLQSDPKLSAPLKSAPNLADLTLEVFNNLTTLTYNEGAVPEHRAINYVAVRYDKIYQKAMELHALGNMFTGVDVRPASIGGAARTVVTVIFSYVNTQTDVTQKWACVVDVTEQYPFLAAKLHQYFERA